MTSVSHIICGWYTPDYAHWARKLQSNLNSLGVSHDLVEVAKRKGGWEANTLAKPIHIRDAMERHPGKTIIFLDVDCEVIGTQDDLAQIANISGDVGLYARTRIRRNGTPLFAPRSGTLVLRPTERTRTFLDVWIDISARAPRFTVDQTSLTVALGRVPGITITALGVEACSVPNDRTQAPIILHQRASADIRKAGRFEKLLGRLLRRSDRLSGAVPS